MLRAEPVQFNFPLQPTPTEFVFALLLWWLIALALIAVGTYALHRKRNAWIKLAALLALALGALFCFLLGFSFTPFNHHRYGWSSTDRDINDWINWTAGLMIWTLSSLLFWAIRRVAKRGGEHTEPNAN